MCQCQNVPMPATAIAVSIIPWIAGLCIHPCTMECM